MANLEGYHVGEFGKWVELYCRKDGVIQDLSAYSTGAGTPYSYSVKFWSPKPVRTFSLVDSDSVGPGASSAETAGIVKFQCSSAKTFDRAGEWQGQVLIEGTNTFIKSDRFTVNVKE